MTEEEKNFLMQYKSHYRKIVFLEKNDDYVVLVFTLEPQTPDISWIFGTGELSQNIVISSTEEEFRLNKILKEYKNKVRYFFTNCSSDKEIECFAKMLKNKK